MPQAMLGNVRGPTPYMHFKWASSEPDVNTDLLDVPDTWIGIHFGFSAVAPSSFDSYIWYRCKGDIGIKGDTGDNGIHIGPVAPIDPAKKVWIDTSYEEAGSEYGAIVKFWDGTNWYSAKSNESVSAIQSAEDAEQVLQDLINMIGSTVPSLVGGVIPLSQIPATATMEIFEISVESELTSLTAQRGDIAELIENVESIPTIVKVWQCLGDPTISSNWKIWGTSYAVQAGSATIAENALNAEMINGHRVVRFDSIANLEAASKVSGTLYYAPYDEV